MDTTAQRPEPLTQVRTGMPVVDADGRQCGTVEAVHLGDSRAQRDHSPEPDEQGGAANVPGGALPDSDQARLEHLGYVQVDCSGLLSGRAFAPVDVISAVHEDAVHLAVPEHQLLR